MIVKPETASKERRLTPLWIISLFVGLTEAVLAAAVTQTTGGVQVALAGFVMAELPRPPLGRTRRECQSSDSRRGVGTKQ